MVETRDVLVTIKSRAEKKTKDGDTFWTFGVLEKGKSQPAMYRLFDYEGGKGLEVDSQWMVRLEDRPREDGKPGVWRYMTGVLGPPDDPGEAPTYVEPNEPPVENYRGNGAPAESGRVRPGRTGKDDSIERQVALKATVDMVCNGVHSGEVRAIVATAEQLAYFLSHPGSGRRSREQPEQEVPGPVQAQ